MAAKTTLKRCALALVLSPLLLTGCLQEEIEKNLHQPGEYKGKQDPFLEISGTPELTSKLEQRLQQVQTDR
jgi:hypothetical protein